MFDIRDDVLVFIQQTHHPVLEHHTGYLFAEYRVTYRKPRELFFQHYYEVVVYAAHTGAKIELNPDRKPDIVTALDYVLNQLDDSQYGATGSTGLAGGRVWKEDQAKGKGPPRDVESPATDVQAWEDEEEKGTGLGVEFGDLTDGSVDDIDFFGE